MNANIVRWVVVAVLTFFGVKVFAQLDFGKADHRPFYSGQHH